MSKSYETHNFFCLNCGAQGIPLPRKKGKQKENMHRKKMYCWKCKETVNHIECKTPTDISKFKEDFEQGVYENEAKDSMDFIQNEKSIGQFRFGY